MADWDSFTVQLDQSKNWSDSTLTVAAVCGDGNNGQDAWGWQSGGELRTEGPDAAGKIVIHLITPGNSDDVAWLVRVMRDGIHPEVAGGTTTI
jgi:hypothetical protein